MPLLIHSTIDQTCPAILICVETNCQKIKLIYSFTDLQLHPYRSEASLRKEIVLCPLAFKARHYKVICFAKVDKVKQQISYQRHKTLASSYFNHPKFKKNAALTKNAKFQTIWQVINHKHIPKPGPLCY